MEHKQSKAEAVCLVGTMIPEMYFARLQQKSKRKAAVSPNIMQINLYSSLAQVCEDVSCVSYPAIATWPGGGILGTWAKRLRLNERLWVNQIGMINLPVLKQITVFVSMLISLFIWAIKRGDKQRYILTYADFAEYCIPALWIGKLFCFPVCLFLTELPGREHYKTERLSLKDQMIIWAERYKRSLYAKYDGFVFVSACSAEVVPVGDAPWTVVEGFAEETLLYGSSVKEKEQIPTAMYAGSLGAAYNIPVLCDAFKAVKGDYRLWICGDGTYRECVQKAAEEDSRIVYFGRLPREKVVEYEHRAYLLIHAKSAGDEHSRYAFSSKILEYMVSGTPVLTTRVDGVPDEYYEHAFVVDGDDSYALAEALQTVLALPKEELGQKGEDARLFLITKKNKAIQGEKILNMMRATQR